MYEVILMKKLKEITKELKLTEKKYTLQKSKIFPKLSLIQKLCLISLLTDKYNKALSEIMIKQRKTLISLWKSQRDRSPECIKSFSKTKLSVQGEEALRYGLNHHILPKKFDSNSMKDKLTLNSWSTLLKRMKM